MKIKLTSTLSEDLSFVGLLAEKINIEVAQLSVAKKYAQKEFEKAGKSLEDFIPDFDTNYTNLQIKTKQALNISRKDMPVIEPIDIKRFQDDLDSGRVDIFKPYAKGVFTAPKNLTKGKKGYEWIKLGTKDGDPNDDVVDGKLTTIPVMKLIPTQGQIWLDKLIKNLVQFGKPKQGSPLTKAVIVTSREGYILDGHHRYGQVMLSNPKLKMRALRMPLDIHTLIKISRSYGNAIGNKQKA